MPSEFYYDGFAWICRQCESELNVETSRPEIVKKAFMEGEAESRVPNFASKAMAKWADPARRFLMCPRCGITEDTEDH